jgi:hypothetical protein
MKLDITRIPTIEKGHFKDQAAFIDSINPGSYGSTVEDQLELTLQTFLDLLKYGGTISVADIRRMTGKKVATKDYYFGWDISVITQLNIVDGNKIIFPAIYCKQILEPNTDIFDYSRLAAMNVSKGKITESQRSYGRKYLDQLLELGEVNRNFVNDVLDSKGVK